MTDNNTVERIRKLLALSKSDNQHEAELAAAHASRLMEEHQLSMTDVDVRDMADAGVTHEPADLNTSQRWRVTLANGCGKLFDCGGFFDHKGTLDGARTLRFVFIGAREDIAAARELYGYLADTWEHVHARDLAAAKRCAYDNGRRWGAGDSRSYSASHGMAYASAIYFRCEEVAKARRATVAAAGTTGTALVVLRGKQVSDYTREHFPNLRSSKASGGRSSAGYEAGSAAGKAAGLGRRIGSGSGRYITS